MASEFGKLLRVSLFGESHGKAVGVLMDGLPAGEPVDQEELQRFMDRRKPRGPLSTKRREDDRPVFLSGLLGGKTCAAPLCAYLENRDTRSGDYEALLDVPRPSHADYTAYVKWGGQADMRGGGHFSGRLTAPLCVAGGIALQILARKGVFVGAHLLSVADIAEKPLPLFPSRELFAEIAAKPFPTVDDERGREMQAAILEASREGDSVGGVIECAAIGLRAGLGSPMFDGVENRLSAVLFGVPAVRGVSFGEGFDSAGKRGSVHNDPFCTDAGGRIKTSKNSSGGINGGITNGMPITLRVAIKPTPSIAKPQRSVRLSARAETELVIGGRHDPCIAHRAVPVIEAVTALVLLDMILEEEPHGFN